MVIEKEVKREPTPEPEPSLTSSESSEEDFTPIDYQRSVMYEEILLKKGFDYYRDTQGFYQLGPANPKSSEEYNPDLDEPCLEPELPSAEMDYYLALFQNKQTLESGVHNIEEIYAKALSTLKSAMRQLLLSDKFAQVQKFY